MVKFRPQAREAYFTFKRFGFLENVGMSIALSIVCPGAIIIAADSQITDPNTGSCETVEKIQAIEMRYNRILVAQAGLWPFTNRVLERFQAKTEAIHTHNPTEIAQILEATIRETKEPLDEEQQKFVSENGSAMIMAFYCEKKPYLYRVQTHQGCGLCSPANVRFIAAGCGAYLAEYLLSEYLGAEAPIDVAVALAIYVIKKVKDSNKFCGGSTRVRILFPVFIGSLDYQYVGRWQPINQNLIQKAEVEFGEWEKDSITKRRLEMNTIIGSVARDIHEETNVKSAPDNTSKLG